MIFMRSNFTRNLPEPLFFVYLVYRVVFKENNFFLLFGNKYQLYLRSQTNGVSICQVPPPLHLTDVLPAAMKNPSLQA